jgi:hypothetical protein
VSDAPVQPVHAFRCVASERRWWTAGKLYPVVDGVVVDDDPTVFHKDRLWTLAQMEHVTSATFVEVWILPDGTELEAVE